MRTLTMGLLLVGFMLLDSCSCTVEVPTFSNKTCAAKYCVGYVEGSVQWYIFRSLSYSSDTNEIDDEDYINFIPLYAKLCSKADEGCVTPLEVFDLQSATSVSTEGETDVWNGAEGITVNFTLSAQDKQLNPFQLMIKIYLLEYATRVVEPNYTFKVNPGDVVIDYYWNYTSTYAEETNFVLEVQVNQFSAACWLEIDNQNAWTQYQFTKDCTLENLIGFPLSVSPEAILEGDAVLPVTVTTTPGTTTNGLLQVTMAYDNLSEGSYNMIVSTGKDKFFIWMVTLVVVGGLLTLILLAGFGLYVFKQKKANAKQFHYDNVMGYSD